MLYKLLHGECSAPVARAAAVPALKLASPTPIISLTESDRTLKLPISGGDMVSTCVAKLQVHAEVQVPRKTVCKLIVANDDNYALAA